MYSLRFLLFDNLFSGPPPAVNFTAFQYFNETVISWTLLPDEPCEVDYSITINDSEVKMVGNGNEYRRAVNNECGSTLEISMFANSTVGAGEAATKTLALQAARECRICVTNNSFNKVDCTFRSL